MATRSSSGSPPDDRGGQPRARGRGPQWQRRYYRLRTEEGEVYEIYADWSPARRGKKGAQATRWYLHRRLSPGLTPADPDAVAEPEPSPASDAPA